MPPPRNSGLSFAAAAQETVMPPAYINGSASTKEVTMATAESVPIVQAETYLPPLVPIVYVEQVTAIPSIASTQQELPSTQQPSTQEQSPQQQLPQEDIGQQSQEQHHNPPQQENEESTVVPTEDLDDVNLGEGTKQASKQQ